MVYNAWEEKYMLSYILYLQIWMNIRCQQGTGDVVSGRCIFRGQQRWSETKVCESTIVPGPSSTGKCL